MKTPEELRNIANKSREEEKKKREKLWKNFVKYVEKKVEKIAKDGYTGVSIYYRGFSENLFRESIPEEILLELKGRGFSVKEVCGGSGGFGNSLEISWKE